MSIPNSNQQRLVTADLLTPLPEPAQRYLNYTGVVGKPWINTVRITYTGIFRLAADKPWMPIKANSSTPSIRPAFTGRRASKCSAYGW